MGAVEKRAKKQYLQRVLLETVAGAGLVGVALLLPNAAKLLSPLVQQVQKKTHAEFRLKRSLNTLLKKEMLARVKTTHGMFFSLTEKGRQHLTFLEMRHKNEVIKKRRWDGRWRVLVFDIQEERKKARNKLRSTLKEIGFVQLQKSVWVFPYDCEDFVALLKAECGVGKAVLYMVVDVIEYDTSLRRHFKLHE